MPQLTTRFFIIALFLPIFTYGSYLWDFGDGTTSNAPSPTHNFEAAGAYKVCLTTTGNCDREEFCQTLQIVAFKDISGLNLQIEEELKMGYKSSAEEADEMKIIQNYPNPFVNQTYILFELTEALFSIILWLSPCDKSLIFFFVELM